MFKNYVKIAFRNLTRHKGTSFINIVGLAIGVATCFLILMFVLHELSFDRFHKNAGEIYRVAIQGKLAEKSFRMALSPLPLAETFVQDFPEVVNGARILRAGEALVKFGDKQFYAKRACLADPQIFQIFDIPIVKGDAKSALQNAKTAVISESTAKRYFGNEDPIGKTFTIEGQDAVTVSAVARDMPDNSHFHFDIMGSLKAIEGAGSKIWVLSNVYSYIQLRKGANPAALEAKLPDLVKKYAAPQLEQALGIEFDKFKASGQSYGFFLQPLTGIHLHSNLDYEIEPGGDMTLVVVFSLVALFILAIACINFMNLATARSSLRANEVGMRKVLGSTRRDLIVQFLTESVVMTFFALLLGMFFIFLILPAFNNLTGKSLVFGQFLTWLTIPALAGAVLVVGLIAGSYPAFYLASFEPVRVLKGKQHTGGRSIWIRKGLVLVQFAISIALFFSTIVVYNQIRYARGLQQGIDRKNVIVLNRADILKDRYDGFKTEILRHPGIEAMTAASAYPGSIVGNTVFWKEGDSSDDTKLIWMMMANPDYEKVMKLSLVSGRFLSKDFATDDLAVVLNESAVKELGFKGDPVGKRVMLPRGAQQGGPLALSVVGVVKDFHFESLHQKIRPLLIANFQVVPRAYILVRVKPEDKRLSVAHIEAAWKKFVPDRPLEYFYLEDRFNDLYKGDERTGRLFGTFSLLAIFIGCLGLLGLASFTAERRTKEIGIRKVLGASTKTLFLMLSREFTRLVLIANVIALPVAFYAMHRWLQNFAYRTSISVWVFLASAFLAWVIATLTVSYQALKAANQDPVRSLRYE